MSLDKDLTSIYKKLKNASESMENFMKQSNKRQTGFTLIELMIVVGIIAIIISLAIPAYQVYAVRAKVGEALSVSAAAKIGVTEACQTNPLLTPTNSNSGYSFTASTYVSTVVIGGTCTAPTIQLTTQGVGATPAPVLVLTGNYTQGAGRYSWICSRQAGNSNHVPPTCRST